MNRFLGGPWPTASTACVVLWAIWSAPGALLLAFVAIWRRKTLGRVGPGASIAKYLATGVIDHATSASRSSGLTLWLAHGRPAQPTAAACVAGAISAGCLALLAIDVALFAQGGLRLQWRFVGLVGALGDFARGGGWIWQACVTAEASLGCGAVHASIFARLLASPKPGARLAAARRRPVGHGAWCLNPAHAASLF